MSQLKCLLFDNDGTLVDSEQLCNHAIMLMFGTIRVELSTEDLVRRYRGWKLANIFSEIAENNQCQLPADFVTDYRSLVAQLFDQKLGPVPGIRDALQRLPHPKAVVSNGPTSKIKHSLKICDLEEHFSGYIFSAYEVGLFKPDPRLYLHCAREMGFQPAECAVIEDSLTGVEAGINAGMSVFFYNAYNEHCPYDQVVQFNDMKKLPELISGARGNSISV